MARPDLVDPVLAELAAAIRAALAAAGLPDVDPDLERPKQVDHGDWATTAALRLAKPARRSPRDIAAAIVDHLEVPDAVASVDIAGPGFVNFRLAHRYHQDLVRRIVAAGDRYGTRTLPDGDREAINVEFVSANPTGPLHVGAGRWAATGDAIAALLDASGHTVTREYYVNDAGEQIRRFGESVVRVATDQPLGEEHYRGAIIGELAAELIGEPAVERDVDGVDDASLDAEVVGQRAVEAMRARIAEVLHTMGVDFDVWFSERRGLHDTGAIEATVAELTDRGEAYHADGALFLRTSDHGDDKDRVLVRSDGRPTYFAADCAYLRDKWSRVVDRGGAGGRLFYLLGADHHGYVARLKAAAASLGVPPDRIEVRIGQLVNLLRDGAPVRMSKRAGETVDLDEVLDEVGSDVTRYHFLRQGLDTTVDFDLTVVAQQSMDNPVYYVQYAHARINSLIRAADERGFDHGVLDAVDLAPLTHAAELDLLRALAMLPLVVAEAAELRATQRLARYAEDLAATFHRFYTECRVLVPGADDFTDVDAVALARARYWLAVAAKQVLANALGLLRVAAPERM